MAGVKRIASFVKIAAMVMAGLAVAAPSPAAAGKGVILLVRHAERVPAPATDDAPLTDAGRARAQRLAALLAKADIKSIFVTRFGRTQATAKPLADALNLTPIEESDTVQIVAKLKTHADETVLVVGHSDTVPDVIKGLGGPSVTIADDEFDDLFLFVPATGTLTRLKY